MQRTALIVGLVLACLGCKPAASSADNAAAEAPRPGDPALPRAGLYQVTRSDSWLTGGGEIAPPADIGTICIPPLDLASFATWASGNIVPRCPSDVTLGKGGFDARASCTDPEYGEIEVTSHANYSPDSIDVSSDLHDGIDTLRISSTYRRIGSC